MKALILLVVVVISADAKLTPKPSDHHQQIIEGCSLETGVDLKIVNNPPKELIDDVKKFVLCVFTKNGLQNEAGEMQLKVLSTQLYADAGDPKFADKVMERCAVQKETPEDTAYDFGQCARKMAKEKMFDEQLVSNNKF